MDYSAAQLWDWNRWRGDEAVALLRPVARCFWFEVLGVMWKSGATGELSGSYADLAKLSRTTETEARGAIEEIKLRNVADITDCNGLVTLVCRGMRREHESRSQNERKQSRDRELTRWRVENHRRRKAGLEPLPRPIFDGVTDSVTPNVTPPVTRSVTTGDSPPCSPPSRPSPPLSPSRQISFAAQTSDGLFAPPPNGISTEPKPKSPKNPGRKLTDAENATRIELIRWWTEIAWPAKHSGTPYEFTSRDGAAVITLLKTKFVDWNLDRAKLVCSVYLNAHPSYIAQPGRPLYAITQNGAAIGTWTSQANAMSLGKQVDIAIQKPANGADVLNQRRQPEPSRKLPTYQRSKPLQQEVA